MTTTALESPTGTVRAGRGLVLLAATGPLAVAALRGVLPYSTADDPLTVATKVAASPGAQSAVLWLGYLALLTLPLSVMIVARAAAAARPVLGRIAGVIAWVGFTSLFWIIGTDQLALAGVDAGVPASTVVALTDAVNSHPAASVAVGVFVIAHILGAVLLGIALWRVLPVWAAVALIASQPLHLVFAVIVPNPALDALAWALTALGFAVAAATSVRSSR